MKEKSSSSSSFKRAKRYAKVAGATARVGVGVAADRLVGHKGRAGEALMIRAALGNLKGPVMKVAQLLAAVPNLLPSEYALELSSLQSDAPSMGWPFVRRRMAGELGVDWQNKFKSFDKKARFAASLGQVHHAQMLDGHDIACKLQYPEMDSVIDADLRQLKMAFSLYERFSGALLTEDVFDEISDRLREELDYTREAQNIELYKKILADVDNVHVPDVIKELSTPRLLSMRWLEGKSFAETVAQAHQEERNRIAENMFRLWYTPFYRYGVIHGDPHPGNYTFRPDGSVNLLDFGCIRIFEPELVQAVIMMFQALRDNDQEKAVESYRLWGFDKPSKALIEALTMWARFIYAPFLQDRVCSIETTNTTTQGKKTAAKVYQEIKKISGVSIPRPFVIIDRASLGLGSVFLHLRAEINWFQLFNELTEEFDVAVFKQRQKIF